MWSPTITSDELWHHQRLGAKWGIMNGPPYPLDRSQLSVSEKKAAGIKKLGGGSTSSVKTKKSQPKTTKVNNSYLDDSPKNRDKRCKNMVNEVDSVNASVPRTVNNREWEKAVWDTNTFKDFLKRPSVQKVYEARNKGYDSADGDDVYSVGKDFDTAIKSEIKKYVGEHTGMKKPVTIPGYKEDNGKYAQYLSPGAYMYKMVELADWGDTSENVHKYAHDRAWLYWH